MWEKNVAYSFKNILEQALQEAADVLKNKSKNVAIIAEKFTFTKYISKVTTEILS